MKLKVDEESKQATFQFRLYELYDHSLTLENLEQLLRAGKAEVNIVTEFQTYSATVTMRCKTLHQLENLAQSVCSIIRPEYTYVKPFETGLVITIDTNVLRFVSRPAKSYVMLYALYGICCTYGKVVNTVKEDNAIVYTVETHDLCKLHTELDTLVRSY